MCHSPFKIICTKSKMSEKKKPPKTVMVSGVFVNIEIIQIISLRTVEHDERL